MVEDYVPMFNWEYEPSLDEWLKGRDAAEDKQAYYAEEGGPPDPDYYHHWKAEDATWYQMYENVSEGTPQTPPFATLTELEDYLVTHGTFNDQEENKGGWSRVNAEKFCRSGYAPSFLMMGGVVVQSAGRDIPDGLER